MFAVHVAYNVFVVLEVFTAGLNPVYVSPSAVPLVAVLVSAHPLNVYPVLVKLFSANVNDGVLTFAPLFAPFVGYPEL